MLEMAGKSAALERWLADNENKAVTGKNSFKQPLVSFEQCVAFTPLRPRTKSILSCILVCV